MRLDSAARVITPLTGIRETGANVPCLRHFFPCNETSGTTIIDRKGGVVWAPPGMGFSTNRITSTMGNTDAPTVLSGGNWATFDAAESVISIYVGRVVGPFSRFAIGDVNGILDTNNKAGLGISDGPLHSVFRNPTNYERIYMGAPMAGVTVTSGGAYTSVPTIGFLNTGSGSGAAATAVLGGGASGALTGLNFSNYGTGYETSGLLVYAGGGGSPNAVANWYTTANKLGTVGVGKNVLVVYRYVPGAGGSTITVYELIDADTQIMLANSYSSTPPGNAVGTVTPARCMRICGVEFYGSALFASLTAANLPTDYQCLWMGHSWVNGDKSIHPDLIGVN